MPVDYYLIVASPSLSESQIIVTTSNLSTTIILSYNMEYNISIQGINCAGAGSPATNFGVLYGKMYSLKTKLPYCTSLGAYTYIFTGRKIWAPINEQNLTVRLIIFLS